MTNRRDATAVAIVIVTLVLVAGCHPLSNPVDPRSDSFAGQSVEATPGEPPRVLPEITKWELLTEHSPGQVIGFEIDPDGGYIEPRLTYLPSDSRPVRFFLVMTFAEPVYWHDLEGGVYFWGYRNRDGLVVRPIDWFFEVRPESRQVVLQIETPDQTALMMARCRVVIVDRHGRTAGAINFSFLEGDVDGNGRVGTDPETGTDDQTLIIGLSGMLASPDEPLTIRADYDSDGLVEGGPPVSPQDAGAVGSRYGNNLEGLDFPDF